MLPDDKRKALEEKFLAVLSEYFGYSQSNIIGALQKGAGRLEDLVTKLDEFNKGLDASSKSSLKVATALNWITFAIVIVTVASLAWDIYKTLFLSAHIV